MPFLNLLFQIDTKVFIGINQKFTHDFLDFFFPYFTNWHKTLEFKWILFFCLSFWIFYHKKKALCTLGGLLLTLGLSDALSSHLLKPLFARSRPSQPVYQEALQTQMRLPYPPRNASFPSSHAVNSSAVATFLGLAYPPLTWPMVALSFLVGYSRIYVGVHFPTDILAGWILGPLLGVFVFFGLKRFPCAPYSACLTFCRRIYRKKE